MYGSASDRILALSAGVNAERGMAVPDDGFSEFYAIKKPSLQ
jgi:hypothetical protein